MGPPNRSMGLKPPPLRAPLGELPLHHKAEGTPFFLFPISPSFANAAPSKPPTSRCCFFCSRLNRGAPAGLPGPSQTPPRYGVTRFSSLRKLGGLGGIPGQTRATAGQVRSQFGPSASQSAPAVTFQSRACELAGARSLVQPTHARGKCFDASISCPHAHSDARVRLVPLIANGHRSCFSYISFRRRAQLAASRVEPAAAPEFLSCHPKLRSAPIYASDAPCAPLYFVFRIARLYEYIKHVVRKPSTSYESGASLKDTARMASRRWRRGDPARPQTQRGGKTRANRT
jgi:hypothetical protein